MQYNIVFTKRGNSEVEMRERERESTTKTHRVYHHFFVFAHAPLGFGIVLN